MEPVADGPHAPSEVASKIALAEKMTPRARVYMAICASRHLLLGLFCMIRPWDFTSPSYDVIKGMLNFLSGTQTLVVWGGAFMVVGTIALYAALTGKEEQARLGLRLSVSTTSLWVGGFLLAILTGVSAGWSGVIVWAALAAKDLTMLRDPMRNPFEDRIRKTTARGSAATQTGG